MFHSHVGVHTDPPDEVGRSMHQWNKTDFLNCGIYVMTSIWNLKQPVLSGCFSWMIPNLYINNGWVPSKNLYIIEWNDHSNWKIDILDIHALNLRTMNHWCFEASIPLSPILRIPKNLCFIYLHQHWISAAKKPPCTKILPCLGQKKHQKSSLTQQGVSPSFPKKNASLEVLAIRLKPPLRPSFFSVNKILWIGGFNSYLAVNQPVWNIFPVFRVTKKKSLKPPPKRSDSVVLLQDLSWRNWTFCLCLFGWILESTRMRPTLNVDPFKTSPLETLICVVSTKNRATIIFMISKTGTNKVAPSEFINDYAKWMQF